MQVMFVLMDQILYAHLREYFQVFLTLHCLSPECTINRIIHVLDPFDCTRYHVCHDVDWYNGTYQCPSGYIFNNKLIICEKAASTPLNCGKIDCTNSPNRILLYPTNSAYYAFCIDYETYNWGAYGSILPMMFKCEFQQFETYNQTMGNCTFNCKAKGNFQDPANCQRYYVCSAAGAVGDLISCPHNFVFDGKGCTMDETKCEYPPPLKFDKTEHPPTMSTPSGPGAAPFAP